MKALPPHIPKNESFKQEWFFGTTSIPKGDFFAAFMQAITTKIKLKCKNHKNTN